MQATRYKVPSTAYPRYHNSVKNGVSISKRLNIILKDIGFDNESGRFNLPEIEEPHIIVACEEEQAQTTVDIADIELNKVNSIQEIEKNTYNDFETLINNSRVNDLCPTIVAVELKKDARSQVSDYVKWKHNVIIVVDDKEFISSNTDDVRITNKENLGSEICLMLERIAFRNMLPFIPVLRGLLATADFQPLTEVVQVEISDVMRTILKKDNSFVGWMNDIECKTKSVGEMVSMTERNFEQYLLKDSRNKDLNIFRSDIDTEYIVKFEEGRRGKRKVEEEDYDADDDVPIQTLSIDEKESTRNIAENKTSTSSTADKYEDKAKLKRNDCKLKVVDYFEENDIMYELIGKLAEHIDHTLEQEVITEYKKLPKDFRNLLKVDIEDQNIRDKVADKLFKLFVCTIDSKLDDDDPAEAMVLVKLRYRTGIILRGLRDIVAQLKLLQTTDHHIKLIKVESDRAINRLLGDLVGLFRRSKIPENERPNSGKTKRLNEKVAKKLLEDVQEAKGCGYRYDKLHIFVEEIKDQDNRETVESEIKKILLGFNISDYILSSTTRPVEHFKQVGAQIRVTRSGTLGGFALMGDDEHLCALLSKHVVNGAKDVHYKSNSDGEIVIGSMIICPDIHQEQNNNQGNGQCFGLGNNQVNNDINNYVDVAAAKIRENIKPTCDTHFRNSQKQAMNSKLCKFTDEDIGKLQGLEVHICGASTELGMGTITIPEYHVEGMQKLVLIEDIEEEDNTIHRFSRAGDSGAVICADDPDEKYVNVISMLIGCQNFEEIERNPKQKGEYLSFRMTTGLASLQREMHQEFKLCNDC